VCLAVPAQIRAKISESFATADFGGLQKTINVSLVDAKVGDWVVVHAGYAIQVLDAEEAAKTLELLRELTR
jgi:hydrogenase expression/formation protein HypC